MEIFELGRTYRLQSTAAWMNGFAELKQKLKRGDSDHEELIQRGISWDGYYGPRFASVNGKFRVRV